MNRSGKLVAVNDHYINQLLNDLNYIINTNGLIETRIAKTGKQFVDVCKWRDAGYIRPTGYTILKYRRKNLQFARIIYAKFNGNLEADLVVYHNDYDISNNDKDNLILGTMSEMNKHSIKNPNRKHNPIRHYKISFDIAETIRQLYHTGHKYTTIMDIVGLAKSTISDVINQKIWKRSVHTPEKEYNY